MSLQKLSTFEADHYLVGGVVLSLIIHFLLFMLLNIPAPKPVSPSVYKVNVIPADMLFRKPDPRSLAKVDNQIVSPPDQAPDETKSVNTNLESEKNFSTEKEQIRRGIAPDAGPRLSRDNKSVPSAPPLSKDNKSLNSTKDGSKVTSQDLADKPKTLAKQQEKPLKLKLAEDTLLKRYAQEEMDVNRASREKLEELSRNPKGTTEAFSRPQGSGARFLGLSGIPDYLPHLPDGDITLLNAKANRFAVFVRRVALQVFSKLRQVGWESLTARDIRAISGFSTVKVVLSPRGEILSLKVFESGGSRRFDEVVAEAARIGARDPHPPAQAALSDGNIHLVFKARSWSRFGASGRNGAVSERRWLFLATGLE